MSNKLNRGRIYKPQTLYRSNNFLLAIYIFSKCFPLRNLEINSDQSVCISEAWVFLHVKLSHDNNAGRNTSAVNYLSQDSGEETWESVGMRNRYYANSVQNYTERSSTTRLIGQSMKRIDRCAASGISWVSRLDVRFRGTSKRQKRPRQKLCTAKTDRNFRVKIDFTNSIANDKKPAWLPIGLQGGFADWPRNG